VNLSDAVTDQGIADDLLQIKELLMLNTIMGFV
jgi:hypothetical protein